MIETDKHNGRKWGRNRPKINLFLQPETLYVLEHWASQAGYSRGNASSLEGRANCSRFIEAILDQYLGMSQYSPDQKAEMAMRMNIILEERSKAAKRA